MSDPKPRLRVILASPRGFCAGVVRAIDIVKRALEKHGAPVYVRHQIVHNRHVVAELESLGAVFVESLDEVPDGRCVIFSAHGVGAAVEAKARDRGLPYIDAACPLVVKVHRQGQHAASHGREVILIGHHGHPEVSGTLGRIPGKTYLVATVGDVETLSVGHPEKLTYLTQTTLSVDDTRDVITALKARFPAIEGPDVSDICYATQNRQQAVRELARQVDLLLVVGARNSSNSNRLYEIGVAEGVPSHLIGDHTALDAAWLAGVGRVGLSAGASAPESLVEGVIEQLGQWADVSVETLEAVQEHMYFNLPRELRD